MRKLSLLMHVSLDGFVAGVNGEMDWIRMDNEIFEDAIALAETADAAVYGRVTYQMMEGYWPNILNDPASTGNDRKHAAWVEQVHKIVFSRSLESVQWNNTQLIKENAAEEMNRLKQQEGQRLLIFGSPSITHLFIQHNLIDEYHLFLNPVVLGEGVPLFAAAGKTNLRLLKEKTFSSGVIGLQYETQR